MTSRRMMLKPFVGVLDSKIAEAKRTCTELRQHLPDAKVAAFSKPGELVKVILREARLDPSLIVTDWIGTEGDTSVVLQVKSAFPRMPIVLYTQRGTPEGIVRLQNHERLIDIYVDKNEGIGRLVDVALQFYSQYRDDPLLEDVRLYLSTCDRPEEPFAATAEGELSMVDIYKEIAKGSRIGNTFRHAWRSLFQDLYVDAIDGRKIRVHENEKHSSHAKRTS